MPKQGKTPKKKSKEKTPQKSGESEYPAMDQEELNRLVQNAIEQSQVPRTVNGTGHTDPSEFCATSI